MTQPPQSGVDQLRIENATLRAALQAAQSQIMSANPNGSMSDPGAPVNGTNGAEVSPTGEHHPGGPGGGEDGGELGGKDGQEKK